MEITEAKEKKEKRMKKSRKPMQPEGHHQVERHVHHKCQKEEREYMKK